MPKRNVATNYTFEQQRQEINLIAADLWDGVLGGATTDFSDVVAWGDHGQEGYLKADGTVSTTAAFTFGNKIIGPSTFTIEPTNVNGTVVIAGNLQVDGTQTAVNSTTMDVTDLNITVAKGAANSAAADTAGITVDGANATLQYEDGSPGTWESSLGFRLDGKHGSAGLSLDLAGSADYLIRESTTDDIVQFGGTGAANFFAHNLSSGNIGIAEANPSYKLDVNGTLRVTGLTTINDLSVGGATHGSHSTFSDIFLGGAGHLYAETTASTGNSLSISQNAHVDSDGSWEYIIADKASNLYQYDGKIGFRTASSGTAGADITWSETLTLENTGNATFAGNISCVAGTFFKSSGQAQVNIGSGNAGGALIALDGDSNGDVSGGDFAYLKHDTSGDLIIAAGNPNNDSDIKFQTSDSATLALTLAGYNATFGGDINLSEGKKTIFGSNSGNGAYIKHQSGHLEIKNETGNCYWDNLGLIRIQTYNSTSGSYKEALSIGGGQDVQIPNGYLQIDPTDHDKLKLKVPSGASDDWAYMTFWGEDGNRNAYIGTNAAGDVKVSRDGGCNLELGDNAVFNANVSDSKGNVRSIIRNAQGGSDYTLVASDAGKHIYMQSGNIIVPPGIFSSGDAVTIINATTSDMDINQGTGVSIYMPGGAEASCTLGKYGMCTLLNTISDVWWISGAELSQ